MCNMDFAARKSYRIKDFDYDQNGSYFITVCIRDRKQILSKINSSGDRNEIRYELLHLGKIADKTIREMNATYEYLSVDHYVIMPDHVHFLLSIHGQPQTSAAIARFVGSFKRFCNKEYGKNPWQSRYYDHVIRNQQDYNETWEYIDNNPAKWLLTHQN